MLFYLVIFLTAGILCQQIQEPSNYGAKIRPPNVAKARQILGYDHSSIGGSNSMKFTNNWQQFHTPVIKYNF